MCAALLGLFSAYVDVGITSAIPYATTHTNKESAAQSQAAVCAVDPRENWVTQSENQSLQTTNMLLVCPRVPEVLQTKRQMPLTHQLRDYLNYHLQQRTGSHLEWMFFLKDQEMLFGHSPRSLWKFLAMAPPEISVLSFGHGKRDEALGLFAIRVDEWSVHLLDSAILMNDERPSLTEAEAITITLASLNHARKVAYVPQWWLEVRSSCVEDATWELQFGIDHVVTPDKLCCVSDACQEALARLDEPSRTPGLTKFSAQEPLSPDSDSTIETYIKDFWGCVKSLDVGHQSSPVSQVSEAVAAEHRAAGICRG